MERRDARGEIAQPKVFAEPISWDAQLEAVDHELRRALDTFGSQDLTLFDWVSVLGEEFGEVCKAVNAYEFGSQAQAELDDVYAELIQVAAVAVHVAAAVRGGR